MVLKTLGVPWEATHLVCAEGAMMAFCMIFIGSEWWGHYTYSVT